MFVSVKYYATDPRGSYLDWVQRVHGYGSISTGEVQFIGGAGDDVIYLQSGTSADLTQLAAGNDRIYLTGNLADYSQSIDQGTGIYTLTRIGGLEVGQSEIVKFTVADSDDAVYFADGHVVLNITSNASLFDGSSFLPIVEAALQADGTVSEPVTTGPISPAGTADRVYLIDAAGTTLPLQQQPGQSMKVVGSAGDDAVYVNAGTSVDASELATGNDRLYLTGKLSDYAQSIDQDMGVYTLTRTAGLPAGQIEVVRFTVGDEDDLVYFADGHIVINIVTNANVYDADAGLFLELSYEAMEEGSTPGLNPQPISADDPASDTVVLQGGTLDVAVNFDHPVVLAAGQTVTVLARIGLPDGSTQDVTLVATGDSGTAQAAGVTQLHFVAALPDGLYDTDGIEIVADSLALGTAGAGDFTGVNAQAVLTTFSAIALPHQLVDTAVPTATIAMSDAALVADDTSLVTITFSEAVTGFDNADLTVDNGTLGTVSSSDGGKTWTATFTPNAGVEAATNLIRLAAGSVSDIAGNPNAAADSANYTIDTKAPTLAVTAYFAAENQTSVATLAGTDAGAISYSLAGGADDGLFTLNSEGVLSFLAAPDYEAPGSGAGSNSHSLLVRMTDASGNTVDRAITVDVTNVNEAPILASPLADQRAAAGVAFSFAVPGSTFTDVDASPLTYSARLTDGSALPGWLSFDATTQTFSGTPTGADLGTLSIELVASDGSLSASDTFDLVIKPATHIVSVLSDAPAINGLSTVNGTDAGGLVNFTVTFSQALNDAANALTPQHFVLLGADGVTPYDTADNFAWDVALDTSDTSQRSYVVSFYIGSDIDQSQVHLKFVADPGGTGAAVRDGDGLDLLNHLALADEAASGTTPFTQSVDTELPFTDGIVLTGGALADGAIDGSEAAGTTQLDVVGHAADATKVEIYADDGATLLATADAAGGWRIDVDLSALAFTLDSSTGAGSYQFQLKQYDDGGNVAQGGYGVYLDTLALDALVTTNVPSAIGNGDYTGAAGAEVFTIGGSAQEAGTVTVAWDKGGDGTFELTQSATVTTAGALAWSVDFSKADLQAHAGSGAFRIGFTDFYGNTITTSQTVLTDVVI